MSICFGIISMPSQLGVNTCTDQCAGYEGLSVAKAKAKAKANITATAKAKASIDIPS